MVTVAVQLDSIAFDRILAAVKAGKYASPHDFIVAAAWNQLALDDMSETTVGNAREVSRPQSDPRHGRPSPGPLTTVDLRAADLPAVPPLKDETRILWGQINRVLPIAVGLRALAHLSQTHPEGVPAELWHDEATNAAIALRVRLKRLDEEAGRIPGMRWAVGLPGPTPESRHRYTNQFLGEPRASTISDGGCLFLGLAVARESSEGMLVVPSGEGARWVGLTNPLLDDLDPTPTSTFGEPEVEFYINHVDRYRPAESTFMRAIAGLVAEGHSREGLDEAIAGAFPELRRVSGTMRAGALGRMSDLGLVERIRSGSNVEYRLTPLAQRVGFGAGDR